MEVSSCLTVLGVFGFGWGFYNQFMLHVSTPIEIWVTCLLTALAIHLEYRSRHFVFRRLVATIIRMTVFKGFRARGVLTGLRFPVRPTDVSGTTGAALLTEMLRHGGHLPEGVCVLNVTDSGVNITDGLKGDKAILHVTYDTSASDDGNVLNQLPPQKFFVKFNVQMLGVARLLVETTEVCRCEAMFYHDIAHRIRDIVPSPTCYYTDYSEFTGEFVLISSVVPFGDGKILPLKHRIRDANVFEEHLLFVKTGAKLNATLWGENHPALANIPRFDRTHTQMWFIAQLTGRLGLRHTLNNTLKGRVVNQEWMTWTAPPELVGREVELINDMPAIMSSLCEDTTMLAFGHNDYTTDNAYFWHADVRGRDRDYDRDCGRGRDRDRVADTQLRFGLFDWQQGCVNNVGQEWAWNFHFLEPEFLTQHEDTLINHILQTYADNGVVVPKQQFLSAYVLGTVQMFVWSGGGLQFLLADLHTRGLFVNLRAGSCGVGGGGGAGGGSGGGGVDGGVGCSSVGVGSGGCTGGARGGVADVDVDVGDSKNVHTPPPPLDDVTMEKLTAAEMSRRGFTNCCNIMTRHNFVTEWDKWKQQR